MAGDMREKLQEILWDCNTEKSLAAENSGGVVARRWAVLHTEVEKALAYYIAFLEPKTTDESEGE